MKKVGIPNQEKIVSYYQGKLADNGFTAQGMDWKDESSQELRFEVLNRYIDFTHEPSILDVGCGAGAYCTYTRSLGKKFKYTGLDIVDEMIDHVNTHLEDVDTFLGPIHNYQVKHDYVIASGTFNASIGSDMDTWIGYVKQSIIRMFELAEKAVVINLMSPYVDYTYDRLYYPDLNDITAFIIAECGRDFIIDHDYDLYEFTLKISKTR